MENLNLWFFPIAAAAVHGLFLAIVFLLRSSNRKVNRWFAFLLLAISLHLMEYSWSISGLVFQWPHLMFLTYPLFFVIAPLYYLYVRQYLQLPIQKLWLTFLHFIPACLIFLMMLPFYLQGAEAKLAFFSSMAEQEFKTIPPEQFIIMFTQTAQFLIYLFLNS